MAYEKQKFISHSSQGWGIQDQCAGRYGLPGS